MHFGCPAVKYKPRGCTAGCPCGPGRDPMKTGRSLAEKGVTIYVVGCEPSITPYRDWFTALAHLTGGQYVPLASARTLPQVRCVAFVRWTGILLYNSVNLHYYWAHCKTAAAFLSTSNVVKPLGGWSSAPDPAGGAYSAPPDPLAGGQGTGCTSPRTQPQLSALRASNLVAFGYSFHAPIVEIVNTSLGIASKR